MSTHRSAESVIQAAEKTLSFARHSWADYESRGEDTERGLYNTLSQGRSVSFILQNLRSFDDEFDAWYEPNQEEMRANPHFKWLVELRNRVEKQGQVGSVSARASLSLNNDQFHDLHDNAPDGTVSSFIGDQLGRSGWEVELPDGSQTTVYFSVPKSVLEMQISVAGAPEDFSFERAIPAWLDKLTDIVRHARDHYC